MSNYKTVKIFSQEWMAENLNIDTYRNGDPILHADTEEKWLKYSEKGKGCWCYYDNEESNGRKYGKLYNWFAVNDSRGLAPVGFKIPAAEDWEKLIEKLEDDALGKMVSPSSFAAPLGGMCQDGICFEETKNAYFSSTTRDDDECIKDLEVIFWEENGEEYGRVELNFCRMDQGISVRCLKDDVESNMNDFKMDDFKTVKIFSQEWMAVNLNVDTYRNGDPILHADSEKKWIKYTEKERGCWCYYGHSEANGRKNGKLYNFYAVKDPRGLCPNEFKVPSENDFERLIENLGGEENAGKRLTDEFGFNLVGCYMTYSDPWETPEEMFFNDKSTFFWSSNIIEEDGAIWCHPLIISVKKAETEGRQSQFGFFVRCIKINNEEMLKSNSNLPKDPFDDFL